jgi:hypothetical protein
MAALADFKVEYQPPSWERLKTSVRTRISVWIGLAAFVGWMLSRFFFPKSSEFTCRVGFGWPITVQERSSDQAGCQVQATAR